VLLLHADLDRRGGIHGCGRLGGCRSTENHYATCVPWAERAVISVVIPVYNERESLLPLPEIADVAEQHRLDLEIVFVDDGSSDGSWGTISALAARHPNVHGLRFRRNFGKAEAAAAGFHAARGGII
jgi:GT2 family glycosyltransferase